MEQGGEHAEHAEHHDLPPQLVHGQQPRQTGRRRKCDLTLKLKIAINHYNNIFFFIKGRTVQFHNIFFGHLSC